MICHSWRPWIGHLKICRITEIQMGILYKRTWIIMECCFLYFIIRCSHEGLACIFTDIPNYDILVHSYLTDLNADRNFKFSKNFRWNHHRSPPNYINYNWVPFCSKDNRTNLHSIPNLWCVHCTSDGRPRSDGVWPWLRYTCNRISSPLCWYTPAASHVGITGRNGWSVLGAGRGM
jgi:hypothetical protein